MRRPRTANVYRLLASVLLAIPVSAAIAQTDNARLERELARLAPIGGGTVGVAALHLESGRSAYLNRSVGFPMASTFKIPVAVQLLTRVDRGEVKLDSMITIQSGDLHPGSGTMSDLLDDPGVALSIRNLLELMLLISDNSATDVVLRLAGGPAAVTARMRSLGVEGIRVDRPTIRLIADYVGVALPSDNVSPVQWRRLTVGLTDSTRTRAALAFTADTRDLATPEGMALLLQRIWRREALSGPSTDLLLDVLKRVSTGANRLKGILPPETIVRHKTGTLGGATATGQLPSSTNDVGIMELPEGAGHVVIAVFVKNSTKDDATRERVIAQIARSVYDYFLFVPSTLRQ